MFFNKKKEEIKKEKILTAEGWKRLKLQKPVKKEKIKSS